MRNVSSTAAHAPIVSAIEGEMMDPLVKHCITSTPPAESQTTTPAPIFFYYLLTDASQLIFTKPSKGFDQF
jgi:hypothetical protein